MADLWPVRKVFFMTQGPKKGSQNGKKKAPRPGTHVIFRRYRTTKDGKVLDAYDYGLKAWPLHFKN